MLWAEVEKFHPGGVSGLQAQAVSKTWLRAPLVLTDDPGLPALPHGPHDVVDLAQAEGELLAVGLEGLVDELLDGLGGLVGLGQGGDELAHSIFSHF